MKRLLLAAGFCALALPAFAQTTKFQAQMTGAQEVPPKQTNGTGTANVALDGNTITYDVEYSGLTGPATAGHIHGPAAPGANAAPVVPFTKLTSPIHGTANLTEQQKSDLMAGKYYVNIHTAQNPGGEIRGQLQKQ